MKSEINIYKAMGNAVVIAALISHCQVVQAGWSGVINGNGVGWASSRVSPGKTPGVTKTLSINNVSSPSAAMTTDTTYRATGPLPNDANSLTVAKIKGSAGYIWTANTRGASGDTADSPLLESPWGPTSSDASTALEVLGYTKVANACGSGVFEYTFTWHWSGSDAGTAQRISFYHFVPSDPDPDHPLPDDFDGDFASLDGATLLASAFASGSPCGGGDFEDFEVEGPCLPGFDEDYTLSFCTTETDISKIWMVTEGVAESLDCSVTGLFNGFLSPVGGADATGGSCDAPVRKFKFGNTIPVEFRLGGCNGATVTPGDHTLWLKKCGTETLIPATSTDRATIGNLFRKVTNKWHYDLYTKGLSKGTWELIAILYDDTEQSSQHIVFVELR